MGKERTKRRSHDSHVKMRAVKKELIFASHPARCPAKLIGVH
jgi:hypothetical protein